MKSLLRCIKDWMNNKNTFHIISLERKMIWVLMDIRSLLIRPHPLPHPKLRPHVVLPFIAAMHA